MGGETNKEERKGADGPPRSADVSVSSLGSLIRQSLIEAHVNPVFFSLGCIANYCKPGSLKQ